MFTRPGNTLSKLCIYFDSRTTNIFSSKLIINFNEYLKIKLSIVLLLNFENWSVLIIFFAGMCAAGMIP